MVFADPSPLGFDIWQLAERAKDVGLRIGSSRMVIHFQTDPQAIDDLISLVRTMLEERIKSGYKFNPKMARRVEMGYGSLGVTGTAVEEEIDDDEPAHVYVTTIVPSVEPRFEAHQEKIRRKGSFSAMAEE